MIGSSDLQKLKAKINYETQSLEIGNKQIPFYHKNYIEIPVNVMEGDVLLPKIQLNNHIIIPENLSRSYNGICTIQFKGHAPPTGSQ